MGGSLPFRCGVVVSLRPLSVCQGSWLLVPALFPGLSLSLPVPIFSWLLLLIRQVLWVCCLPSLWLCAHLLLGRGFSYASCLPFALLWALGLLVQLASLLQWSSLRSRWGHPCGVVACLVLDRNEGLVSPFEVSYAGQFLG